MKNIFKNIKKSLVVGAVLAGFAFAPAFANEVEVDNTPAQIAQSIEGMVFSSVKEAREFCLANGYALTRNTEKDCVDGKSYFYVLICGTELKAEVVVDTNNQPEVEVPEVEVPEVEETFEPVLDGTEEDNMMVTPEVEETFEPVLDGTEEDNMMVTPEVEETFEPVLDGTKEDNMMVTPEVEETFEPVLDGTKEDNMMVTPEVEVENTPVVEEEQEVLGTEDKVVEETVVENTNNNVEYTANDLNPKTGDASIALYVAVALLSVVGLIATRRFQ